MKSKKPKPYYKRQFLETGIEPADSYLVTQVEICDWMKDKLPHRLQATIKAADCNRHIIWIFAFDDKGKLRPYSKKKLDKIIKQLEDFRTACTS